jgi:hypothetical protein
MPEVKIKKWCANQNGFLTLKMHVHLPYLPLLCCTPQLQYFRQSATFKESCSTTAYPQLQFFQQSATFLKKCCFTNVFLHFRNQLRKCGLKSCGTTPLTLRPQAKHSAQESNLGFQDDRRSSFTTRLTRLLQRIEFLSSSVMRKCGIRKLKVNNCIFRDLF